MLLRYDLRGINICQSMHPFSLVYLIARFGEPHSCLFGHASEHWTPYNVDVLSGRRGFDAPAWCRRGGVCSRGAFGTMRVLFKCTLQVPFTLLILSEPTPLSQSYLSHKPLFFNSMHPFVCATANALPVILTLLEGLLDADARGPHGALLSVLCKLLSGGVLSHNT